MSLCYLKAVLDVKFGFIRTVWDWGRLPFLPCLMVSWWKFYAMVVSSLVHYPISTVALSSFIVCVFL